VLSRARDPEALLRPSTTPDVETVREISLLRHPGREPNAKAVFANPDRRQQRYADTGEEAPHLDLPNGVVWVTAGDSYTDLARHRIAAAAPVTLTGTHGVVTPVLDLWLTQAPYEHGSGLRIAVLKTAGREPGDIERMLAGHLADETIVGVRLHDDGLLPIKRMALKSEAIELLREHGHLHDRTADVPVSHASVNGRLTRFKKLNDELEAWDQELQRFFRSIGRLMRRPIPAMTGAAALIAILLESAHQLGLI